MKNFRVVATILITAGALLTGCDVVQLGGTERSSGGPPATGGPQASGGVGTPADPAETTGPTTSTKGPTNDPSTNAPTGNPTPAGPPPDNRPVIGNIEMSAANVQCSYVPNGNLDGSDGLTVFAYTLLIGTNRLPQRINWLISFSNGYQVTSTGDPNNSSPSHFQGPIRSGDWGKRLVVRIVADSGDRFRESNENDNSIVVTVTLPRVRSNQVIDPLTCSAARG
jgi:hypothetical protein